MDFEYFTQFECTVEGVLPVNDRTREATRTSCSASPPYMQSLSLSLSLLYQHTSIELLSYSLLISPNTQIDVCSSPGVMLITPSNSHSSLLSCNTSQYFSLSLSVLQCERQPESCRAAAQGTREIKLTEDLKKKKKTLSNRHKHTRTRIV